MRTYLLLTLLSHRHLHSQNRIGHVKETFREIQDQLVREGEEEGEGERERENISFPQFDWEMIDQYQTKTSINLKSPKSEIKFETKMVEQYKKS